MQLDVQGPCTALDFPVGLPGGRVVQFLVVKQTWRVEAGRLVPHEAPLPVYREDTEVDGRVHGGDVLLHKARADLVVLGDAVAPRAVERTQVTVRAPGLAATVQVTGDRVWERGWLGGYKPTPPVWFERLPLTWARAFGGKAVADDEGTELPYSANPDGRGFVVPGQKRRAEGVALPNVEWPDRAVVAWDDLPEPAGFAFYPRTWALRLLGAVTPGKKGSTPTIEAKAFQQAHPALEVPAFPAGRVEVTGASPAGFAVDVPQPRVDVALVRPDGEVALPLRWDLLVVEPEAGRVVTAGRLSFPYDPARDWAAHLCVSAREASR